MDNKLITSYGFQPVKVASDVLGLKPHWFRDRRLQGQFIEGIHFQKVPGIRSYAYNVELCADFIQTGGDPALHQAAIDEFLAKRKFAGRTRYAA
ncbi:hypothetical protein LQF76_10970 [Gloeomargaritales cyanobacterium VI4D9]|nr:hypothetical protein LQF76_10970 [Gloeomargaritales cyanobacterium VI4D9]